jgi:chemotaxis protein histidine kinase CheA
MTAEMRALLELFYDEAVEHLTDIEATLQHLDLHAPDPGGLESMFRAARSATASTVTLGLADVTELASQFEHMLDRLRHEHLAVTQESRAAGLQASAALKALLAAHRGTATVETACAERACRRLQALEGRRGTGAVAPGRRPPVFPAGEPAVLPVGWRGQGRRTAAAPNDTAPPNDPAPAARATAREPVARRQGSAGRAGPQARRKP